jgi:amino acid adenylation domain-containing protein
MELVTDHPRAAVRSNPAPLDSVPVGCPAADRTALLAAFVVLLHRHTGESEIELELRLAELGHRGSGHPDGGQRRVVLTVDPAESFGSLRARASRPASSPTGSAVVFADRQPAPGTAELALIASPAGEVRLSYAPGLFDRDTADRMAARLCRILQADPAQPVSSIDLLTDAERVLVRDRFNDTGRSYPRTATIHQLFAEQVAARPDAPAVRAGDSEWSYAELAARAGRLAARLRAAGVRAGDPVGVLMPRNPALVATLLAILQAGASYLPLDRRHPADRIAFQLADSQAGALVTDEDGDRYGFSGPVLVVDDPANLDAENLDPDDLDPHGLDTAVTATDIAYLLYTSGTTGRPKGVRIRHRGVVRLVRNTDYLSFGPDTRMLAISSLCFDASTFELWAPLLNGGCVQLADAELALDAAALGCALAAGRITTMLLITPVFNHLAEQDPSVFRPLRELMVGGDTLSGRHVRAVLAACPDLVLLNGYGPTENTTLGSTHRLGEHDPARIPIGRPVANSTAYVRDPAGELCPIGVPGELWLGGDGVAAGYLNRPELTAVAFTEDPFVPDGSLFRTGDLARWRPDGTLEFLGRRDRQVKVRGFRIELAEIEYALRAHPSVRDAVVQARLKPGGTDRYLAAYYVADSELSAAELRSHLRARLPEHMVPAAFARLPVLPLNSSSKVDMDRLPEPVRMDMDRLPEPELPTGIDENLPPADSPILQLVRAALDQPAAGPDDDLHDLGADSLSAARLSVAIAAELGVRLPPGELLRAGSARQIARLTGRAPLAGLPVLTRAPDAPDHPVSPQQRRLCVEQFKDPHAVHYNMPVLFQLPAAVTADRLAVALRELTERHEALRTEFALHNGEIRQRIRPNLTPPLTVLAGDPDDIDGASEPFDLERAPLWRVTARPVGTAVLFELHHAIADGLSLAVLAEELAALCAGDPLPPPPALRYRDYAGFLAGEDGTSWRKAQGSYWHAVFAEPSRRPDLPLDEPRPPIRSLAGGEISFAIEANRAAGLRRLARQAGVTPFAVLAGGYALLLSELTGDPDVTLGTPMAGRNLPGLDRVVGILATTVCLRLAVRPELTFAELARSVGNAAEQAAAHQDYPLEDLAAEVEPGRNYRRHPLFDALIAVHSERYLSAAGGRVRIRPRWTGQSPFDLNLQVYSEPTGLRCSLQYGARILHEATVAGWRDRLLELLHAAVADPSIRLADLTAAGRRTPALEFDL